MLTNEILVDKKAEELFYEQNPQWPRRWGWIEVNHITKEKFRQLARNELKNT